MKKYYTLLDAVEMNIRHPDTFLIPGEDAISAIKPGDFVRLGFVPTAEARARGAEMVERMWVEVSETDAARGDMCPIFLTGRIRNAPFVFSEILSFDDSVAFAAWNIMSIEPRGAL